MITPIADDPWDFGRIAAANTLSDVYAMGGAPVSALSIIAFPVSSEPPETFRRMLQGGIDIMRSAGAALVGGHSIDDPEIKLGFSVTGVVHPDRIMTKGGARPGDVLVLTKAIGTGLVSTALKKGEASADSWGMALDSMTALNAVASAAALNAGVRAATDVTGFGLLGHLREMVLSSGVAAEIEMAAIPLLPGAGEFAERGLSPGGTWRNKKFAGCLVEGIDSMSKADAAILFDPQTSGGLLLAVPEAAVAGLLEGIRTEGGNAHVIGRCLENSMEPTIRVA